VAPDVAGSPTSAAVTANRATLKLRRGTKALARLVPAFAALRRTNRKSGEAYGYGLEGMALRIDHQVYRVLEVESKTSAARMGGTIWARLSNVRGGRQWDQHFRPIEKLEDDVELEKRTVEFLYSDGSNCIFQRLDSFEQIVFSAANLGLADKLLQPGAEVPAEFFEGEPISVVLPDTVEARVKSTAPPVRSQQDSGKKGSHS
jgi:elongation factor P